MVRLNTHSLPSRPNQPSYLASIISALISNMRQSVFIIIQHILEMSFANDPAFIAFKDSHRHVALPIGTVFVLSYKEPLPPVGRRLTKAEGLQYKQQLKQILEQWSIVAFDQGGLTGSGYGYEVKQQVGNECGQGFIVIPGQFQ